MSRSFNDSLNNKVLCKQKAKPNISSIYHSF
ncbi:MAG: HNH endonuclease domain-containing protein [Planctomycetota bacterium]